MKYLSSVLLGSAVVSAVSSGSLDAGQQCSDDVGCHYAGRCLAGICVCDPPFAGPSCESFDIESFSNKEGGLQMPQGNTTWGGSVVRVPEFDPKTNTTSYSYHMYAAMMKHNESLTSWLSNSVVAHAVSTSGLPHGPFEFRDIALDTGTDRWDGVSVHNPDAKVLPDGTIVIYYMGTNNHTAPYPSTGNQLEFNQRIGIAWSKDPNGPWERAEEPVLGPGPNGTWDDGFTTNPAPYIYNNGSVLLIYKAKSFNNTGMFQGVAFAESFNATYKKLSPKPLDLPPQCEDAGIYRTTSGVFRMLTHCGCNGRYLWSLDGIHWNSTTPEQPWCSNQSMVDGNSTISYSTRQRPKWYVDEHGTATLLFTGVNREGDGGMGNTWTMAGQLRAETSAV